MKSDLVKLEVQKHAETEKAYKVSLDGENKNAVWVPKQHVQEYRPTTVMKPKPGVIWIELPEWLALDKGLI